jgi:hypothetical protein
MWDKTLLQHMDFGDTLMEDVIDLLTTPHVELIL